MPNYTYRCKDCNETFDLFLPIARREEPIDKPCQLCNNENSVIYDINDNCPQIADPVVVGRQKPPEAFQRGVLKRIADNVPGNTIRQTNQWGIPKD